MSETVRVILEFELGSEPIHGQVGDDVGGMREYVGWLALITALEELHRLPVQEDSWPVSPLH